MHLSLTKYKMKKMKIILIFIYAFIILTPQRASSEIIEMVPCNKVNELSPKIIKIHDEMLKREFRSSNKDIKKPLFIMYESPAFDPESILVLYKEKTSYNLELLQFDKSLWSQISEQIDKFKTNKYSSKQIKVSYKLSRKSKTINGEPATILKKAIDLVFKKAQMPKEAEYKTGETSLDGSVYTFESTNGECGMILGSYKGNAKRLLEIALFLKYYITSNEYSQTDIEKKLNGLSNDLINNIL
jgi:hypothetical protein